MLQLCVPSHNCPVLVQGLHTTHQAAPDRPFPITGDAMLQHLHQMVARESWFELVARRRDRPEVTFKMTFK